MGKARAPLLFAGGGILFGAALLWLSGAPRHRVRPASSTTATVVAPPTVRPANLQDCSAFHGGGPLLGVAAEIGPPPYKVRWTYRIPEEPEPTPASGPSTQPATQPASAPAHGGAASFEAGAVVVANTVYAADSAGGLHALDLKTGKEKWRYVTENGFGATPLVMGQHVLIGDLDGTFHCVSTVDGKKIWTFDGGSTIHSSANFCGDDRVVFGNDGAEIFCLSVKTGKPIWQSHAGDRINSAPAFADQSVLVSGCDAELRAISSIDGSERWTIDIGALAPGSPAVSADRIVIGADQGRVVCLPRAGGAGAKPLWVFDGIASQAMVYSSPAVSGGIAIVGARDREVWALDLETGKPRWHFPTRGDVDASPVISGGRVYAASKDRHLYVLDLQTGNELWNFNAAKPIVASPTIADGVLILCDSGGAVRCLEPQ